MIVPPATIVALAFEREQAVFPNQNSTRSEP